MKAVYAGSFSPPTLGHLDVIRRASALFDTVVVAAMGQSEKQYRFTAQQRLDMLRAITARFDNVEVVADGGLLVDLVRRVHADVIVRGVRGAEDLAFEMQLAWGNRQLGQVETVFLPCSPEYSMISSTIVRDCAVHGAPLRGMVPDEIADTVVQVMTNGAAHGKEGQ